MKSFITFFIMLFITFSLTSFLFMIFNLTSITSLTLSPLTFSIVLTIYCYVFISIYENVKTLIDLCYDNILEKCFKI